MDAISPAILYIRIGLGNQKVSFRHVCPGTPASVRYSGYLEVGAIPAEMVDEAHPEEEQVLEETMGLAEDTPSMDTGHIWDQ